MFKSPMNLIFWMIVLFCSRSVAQKDYYLTLSTIKARPLSMGSAYTAMEDNIASAGFNPATLCLYRFDKAHRITLFFNPIAPMGLFSERFGSDLDPSRAMNERLKTALLLFKGIAMTANLLDVALILNEQVINMTALAEQRRFFEDCAIWEHGYHSLVARLKLADRVSIGISTSFYRNTIADQPKNGWGFSYGILLKPSQKMNVGVSFVDFPNPIAEVRWPLERLSDQTMNIGIAYRPWPKAIFSLDVRNLTEDERKGVREIHFGFEQNFFSIMAIRAGYFKERFTPVHTFSAGIGLIDSNMLFADENKFNHAQFLLNYALLYQRGLGQIARWHVLSVLVRI